jgi:hypothetical protein
MSYDYFDVFCQRTLGELPTELLSCNDLVDTLRYKLLTKFSTDETLAHMIANRH